MGYKKTTEVKKTTTIEISEDELDKMIREKLNLPKGARINFNVDNVFDGLCYSNWTFTGVSIVYEE